VLDVLTGPTDVVLRPSLSSSLDVVQVFTKKRDKTAEKGRRRAQLHMSAGSLQDVDGFAGLCLATPLATLKTPLELSPTAGR